MLQAGIGLFWEAINSLPSGTQKASDITPFLHPSQNNSLALK